MKILKLKKKLYVTLFYLILTNFIFLSGLFCAEELTLKAYTNNAGEVFLMWNYIENADGYDIYRKSGNDKYVLIASNIKAISDCAAISQLIPYGSKEYELLRKTIAEKSAGNKNDPFRDKKWVKASDYLKYKDDKVFDLFKDPNNYLCEQLKKLYTIKDEKKLKNLFALAYAYWKIAVLLGIGYKDIPPATNIEYTYKVCASKGNSIISTNLCKEVTIKAGVPVLPAPPNSITVQSGDNQVLTYWCKSCVSSNISKFKVYRKEVSAFGNCNEASAVIVVNPQESVSYIMHDLNDVTLDSCYTITANGSISPTCYGFIDFLRFDDSGAPISHDNDGVNITGPVNNHFYCYSISCIDMFGNESPKTAYSSAGPQDKTSPLAPSDVAVTPHEVNNNIEIRWSKVIRDIKGRIDEISGYNVYRYDNNNDINNINNGIKINNALITQPANEATNFIYFYDSDPSLRSPCGAKVHYYRVVTVDKYNNISSYSEPSVSGYLKDITPPAIPKNLKSTSELTKINLTWDLNNDCDISGYIIFRSKCQFGTLACGKTSNDNSVTHVTNNKKCEEYIPLLQIGYVSHNDAKNLALSGSPMFSDDKLPEGSPICYAYLIKAQDESQNLSGSKYVDGVGVMLTPADVEFTRIICARLRDNSAPKPPIISGMKSYNNGISIEWIGAPVQDIKAYHIYRSEKKDSDYIFVGGRTVALPSSASTELNQATGPYKPDPQLLVGCNDITLELRKDMNSGSFTDIGIDPKKVYWYKITAIDQGGNESKLEESMPISNFTFTLNKPNAPIITNISVMACGCGLTINWQPAFNQTIYNGFAVYRSTQEDGIYYQISSLVKDSSFIDNSVIKGIKYWYKIILLDKNNMPSLFSNIMSGKINE